MNSRFTEYVLYAVIVVFALVGVTTIALAQTAPTLQAPMHQNHLPITCTPDGQAMSGFVHEGYGESDVAVALTSTNKTIVLSYNPGTETWSLVGYAPDGSACMLFSGKGPVDTMEIPAAVPGRDG